MKKNFKIHLTEDELKSIITALQHQKTGHALADRMAEKYITSVEPRNNIQYSTLSFTESVQDDKLLKVIIHALAVLTGYPEANITLTTSFFSIGLTPIKKEQLRIHLNRYIRDRGFKKYITSAEMGSVNTVGELYTLAQKKITRS